jgi:hypothetical protein
MDLGMQLQKQADVSSRVSGNSLSLKDSGLNKSATKFGGGFSKSQKLDESFKAGSTQGGVGVPTLEMLNPELFKEIQKAEKQSKDPVLLSVRNLKERHGYQELRLQRIQKRTEEMTKDLEHK